MPLIGETTIEIELDFGRLIVDLDKDSFCIRHENPEGFESEDLQYVVDQLVFEDLRQG